MLTFLEKDSGFSVRVLRKKKKEERKDKIAFNSLT